jgi:hypothetical protein
VTPRPKPPRGGGGDDDDETPPPDDPGNSEPAPRDPHAASIAEAQTWIESAARQGRASANEGPFPSPATRSDDIALQTIMRQYEQLGDQPPTFNVARNDAAHSRAHTIDRHGSDIPLQRDLSRKTIEGRIYGDGHGWRNPENRSYRWTDPITMTREINKYIQENWENIRSDLAIARVHEGASDAGHRVGQGYYNKGMFGVGPREAQYSETSVFQIRIRLVPGSDPPEPFIVSAFPSLLM